MQTFVANRRLLLRRSVRGLLAGAIACAFLNSACSSTPATPGDAATGDVASGADTAANTPADAGVDAAVADDASSDTGAPVDAGLVGERPYRSRVPGNYDAARAWPLVVLLHGYSASGMLQDLYFGLSRIVQTSGFLYAYPDGMMDANGNRYWNATDACCDFARTGVDDVAYVTAVIDDMSRRYNVDPRRIYLIGHSNGGFMAQRMACELSSRIAGVVSLAGASWSDPARCTPSAPVAVLQVHGDADQVISYTGGMINGARFPSAAETVAGWAQRNGCGATLTPTTMTLDIDTALTGEETTVARHDGCTGNGAAELWTIHGGGHQPALAANWPAMIYDWLQAHPKAP